MKAIVTAAHTARALPIVNIKYVRYCVSSINMSMHIICDFGCIEERVGDLFHSTVVIVFNK